MMTNRNRFFLTLSFIFLTSIYCSGHFLSLLNANQPPDSCEIFHVNVFHPPHFFASNECTSDASMEIIHINGGTPPYSYLWSNGDTLIKATNLTPGEQYDVTVTDANGCTGVSTLMQAVHVLHPLAPDISYTVRDPYIDLSFGLNTYMEENLVSFEWLLEGAPNLREFTYTFPEPGSYKLCLSVTYECEGELTVCLLNEIEIKEDARKIVTLALDYKEIKSGDTVQVPVRARNFRDILGFQKSIRLASSKVGKIVGTGNYGLDDLSADNFEIINDTLLSCAWFRDDPITVADDSILYYIEVLLADLDGDCTNITFDDTAIPIQVVRKEADGTPAAIPYNIIGAELCAIPPISISGNIATEYGQAVTGVEIACTNSPNVFNDMGGSYFFEDLARNQNYHIQPSKNEAISTKVSVQDLILIFAHILNRRKLDSPYKMIAADVNGDKIISILDVITIQQAILGRINEFPNTNSWIFIPKSYHFDNLSNPFYPDFPTSITLEQVGEDLLNEDFIGVQMGDVSYVLSDNLVNSAVRPTIDEPPISFSLTNQIFKKRRFSKR